VGFAVRAVSYRTALAAQRPLRGVLLPVVAVLAAPEALSASDMISGE